MRNDNCLFHIKSILNQSINQSIHKISITLVQKIISPVQYQLHRSSCISSKFRTHRFNQLKSKKQLPLCQSVHPLQAPRTLDSSQAAYRFMNKHWGPMKVTLSYQGNYTARCNVLLSSLLGLALKLAFLLEQKQQTGTF